MYWQAVGEYAMGTANLHQGQVKLVEVGAESP